MPTAHFIAMPLPAPIIGRVASLHIHPAKAGEPLLALDELHLVAGKGIRENKRYFGRVNYGKPSKRQVTIIEREIIQKLADTLGAHFNPGEVRSNIETTGIDLIALMDCDVKIGEAIVRFVEPRTPCQKMDELAQGLRELMENNQQGVIAIVIQDGRIRIGDSIQKHESA